MLRYPSSSRWLYFRDYSDSDHIDTYRPLTSALRKVPSVLAFLRNPERGLSPVLVNV